MAAPPPGSSMFHFRESSGTARAIASRRRASPNTHPSDRSDRGLGLRLGLRRKPLETLRNLNPGRFVQTYLWGRPLLGRQGGTEMPNSTSRRWTQAEIGRLKNTDHKNTPTTH